MIFTFGIPITCFRVYALFIFVMAVYCFHPKKQAFMKARIFQMLHYTKARIPTY